MKTSEMCWARARCSCVRTSVPVGGIRKEFSGVDQKLLKESPISPGSWEVDQTKTQLRWDMWS